LPAAVLRLSCRIGDEKEAWKRDSRDPRTKGLTQGDVARSADLSTSQISNIERGEFAPSLDALEKIARALKIKRPHLFQFDLLDGDRDRVEQMLKLISVAETLRPADLEFATDVLRLLSKRSEIRRKT
jgi:transcriptional regulator with XRE-family HTH domain